MKKNPLDDPLTYVKAAILVAVIVVVGILAIRVVSPSSGTASAASVTLNSGLAAPTDGSTNTAGLQGSDPSAGYQEINMTVDDSWSPDSFVVKAGVPVVWNVYVEQYGGCLSGLYSPDLGINYQFQQTGVTKTFDFTPTQAGTIYFSCPMGMIRGQIEVIDNGTVADAVAANAAVANAPVQSSGGCGCGR